MWSIWPSYQGPLLLSKISKSKKSKKERLTFRGARDSALFHRMRKEAILLLHKQEKTLGQYSHKLLIISKQSRLMLTELRYQVKTHTISEKPRKKMSCKFSQFIFFIIKTKTCNMEMTSYAKARSNLCTLDDVNTEKQSFDLFFLSSPKSTCKDLSRDIGGKHNWFLDCI
jgi:hypothetical protein